MNPIADDTPTPLVCSRCNIADHSFLHKLKHRGEYRRFCTSCVLKLNPSAFCPICFSVYHRPKNPQPLHGANVPTSLIFSTSSALTCFKCGAVPHTSCIPPSALTSPYLCPTCSNPASHHCDIPEPVMLDSTNERVDCDQRFRSTPSQQHIDQKSSEAFLAAAWIVANLLKEDAEIKRAIAEHKMKEALVVRKNAQEALQELALLWDKEKESSWPTKEIEETANSVTSGVNIPGIKGRGRRKDKMKS